MRLSFTLVLVAFLFFSCNNEKASTEASTTPQTEEAPAATMSTSEAPVTNTNQETAQPASTPEKAMQPNNRKQQAKKKVEKDNTEIKEKFEEDPAGLIIERMGSLVKLTEAQKAEIRTLANEFDFTSGSELDKRTSYRNFRKKIMTKVLTDEQLETAKKSIKM